ncbi:MAG TPA: hypothetical protein ENI80_05775 [Acidiferrobacteraceae bacterium]|nr:hypothetical protein [Acidiferrobacteraceae bacterium]
MTKNAGTFVKKAVRGNSDQLNLNRQNAKHFLLKINNLFSLATLAPWRLSAIQRFLRLILCGITPWYDLHKERESYPFSDVENNNADNLFRTTGQVGNEDRQ